MSTLAIDIGRTGSRARLFGPRGPVSERIQHPGAAGLADHGGPAGVLAVVQGLWAGMQERGDDLDPVEALGVGVAGFASAPEAARELMYSLVRWRPSLSMVLTSDVVTSHAGALGGRPGTVLAVGTGAVALALRGDGSGSLVDGWGFLLGDDGSGYAVGRAGLAAAVQHHDGRGGSAALHELALQRHGDLRTLPRRIHGDVNPAARVAAFAPDVAAAAVAGDVTALGIWESAARALLRTAAAAARADDGAPIALTGGLLQAGEVLTGPLVRHAADLDLAGRLQTARGGALEGAALLAGDEGLPHAGWTLRHEPPTAAGRPSAASAPGPVTAATPAVPRAALVQPGCAWPSADVRQENLGSLDTERVRLGLEDLDLRSNLEILNLLAEAEETVQHAVAAVTQDLAEAVDTIVARLRTGGRLFYVGAGTPGRLAFLDASELPPTFGTPHNLVVPIMAGGEEAVFAAREGAEDDQVAARHDLDRHDVGPADVVVALTASGRTPYVLAAVEHARALGAATVGVSNNAGARLSALVDHPVEVLTGPEVVAGSTRLKAGTSQKLVLNSLSTTVMIRLGKTYGPWMVDLRATNDKLRARAIRMVTQITGSDDATAEAVLTASGGHVKTAVVQIAGGVEAERARALLTDAQGSARVAIGLAQSSADRAEGEAGAPTAQVGG